MATSFLARHLSLDKIGAGVIAAGCCAVVVDADQTGRAPLVAETPACDYPATSSILTKTQCQQLSNEGFLVVDNFLTKTQVQEACSCIQQLDSVKSFSSSPNEQQYHEEQDEDDLVRTDRVYMYREADSHSRSSNIGLCNVRESLAQFASGLVASDFDGFVDSDDSDFEPLDQLQVPAQMQVSIFGGRPSRDYFTSHLDSAATESFLELGLLGWLRSRYLRKRYMTFIVYLNEDWKEEDGGCLRLHKSVAETNSFDSDDYMDVAPMAGRLVVFSSLSQWHCVLPTTATRYACSLWLTLNRE